MNARADAVHRLTAAGIDNPRLDARLLWDHARKLSSPVDGGGASHSEAEGAEAIFVSLIVRRARREPLAYITGNKEFWSLDFEVGPGVLIPRPETETIVEQVLAAFPDRTEPLNILDLGAGSGCLLIALLKEFQNARGLGVDTSESARDFAGRNLSRHGFSGRGSIKGGIWTEGIEDRFDVIVSNPPYVKSADIAGLAPEAARFEPHLALDGGPDGLAAYRDLAPKIADLLKPGGSAFLEIGAGQDADACAILVNAGLETVRFAPDLAGIPRVLALRHTIFPRDEKGIGKGIANR